jgi:hypothetical protein
MILSYVALAMLICVIILLVYAFIWVHDIPYVMAKKRNHPNLHAIHIGCWLSLFTLHALWPFLFLWAIANKPKFEVIIVEGDGNTLGHGHGAGAGETKAIAADDVATLRKVVAELQQRLDKLEGGAGGGGAA